MNKRSDVWRTLGSIVGYMVIYILGLIFFFRFYVYIHIAINYDTLMSQPLLEQTNEHLAYLFLALAHIALFSGIRFLSKLNYKALAAVAASLGVFYTVMFFTLNTYIKALFEQNFNTNAPFSMIWNECCYAELTSARGWGLLMLAFGCISVCNAAVIMSKPLICLIGKRLFNENN